VGDELGDGRHHHVGGFEVRGVADAADDEAPERAADELCRDLRTLLTE